MERLIQDLRRHAAQYERAFSVFHKGSFTPYSDIQFKILNVAFGLTPVVLIRF